MSARTRASTDGVEPQVASQAAGGDEAVDATKAPPEPAKAPEKAPEPTGSAVATQQAQTAATEQETNFPSPDVRYSELALDSAYVGYQRFQRGLTTLSQMRAGTEARFKTALAELDAKYTADRSQLTQRFEDEAKDLAPRITDMENGLEIYSALIKRAEELLDVNQGRPDPQQEHTDDTTKG